MAGEIYIADKITLDLVKTQVDNNQSDANAILAKCVVINSDTDELQVQVGNNRDVIDAIRVDTEDIQSHLNYGGYTPINNYPSYTSATTYEIINVSGVGVLTNIINAGSSRNIQIKLDGVIVVPFDGSASVMLSAGTIINAPMPFSSTMVIRSTSSAGTSFFYVLK